MTLSHADPSANAPCTRTAVVLAAGAACAKAEAASATLAPAASSAFFRNDFIGCLLFESGWTDRWVRPDGRTSARSDENQFHRDVPARRLRVRAGLVCGVDHGLR